MIYMRGGGGWHSFMRGADEEEAKPHVTWALLKRVLGYARPYRVGIRVMLLMILITTGLGLLTPTDLPRFD